MLHKFASTSFVIGTLLTALLPVAGMQLVEMGPRRRFRRAGTASSIGRSERRWTQLCRRRERSRGEP